MIVVPGPASTSLGEEVARRMGVEPLFINHKIFPDGENYIRVTGEVEGEYLEVCGELGLRPIK